MNFKKLLKKKKIYLIEDTCESLGSKYKKKYLGTFGDFGTYSFFYSHQITSGEGGMIVCNDKKNYEMIYPGLSPQLFFSINFQAYLADCYFLESKNNFL